MNDTISLKKKKLKKLKIIKWFLFISVIMVFVLIIINEFQTSGPFTYCSVAVNCTECQNGSKTCNYYERETNKISEDTIICDCE